MKPSHSRPSRGVNPIVSMSFLPHRASAAGFQLPGESTSDCQSTTTEHERARSRKGEGRKQEAGWLSAVRPSIHLSCGLASTRFRRSRWRLREPQDGVLWAGAERIYLQLLRSAASFIECGMVGRRCSGHNASLPVHLYLHQLRCDYTSAQAGRQTHLEMATTNLFPIAPAGLKLASFCLRLRSRKHNHVPGDQVHTRKENDAPGCAVLVKDGEVL